MLDKSCKNILIRGVNWIGDAVMTMPALKALRKALPDSNISLLVTPWVAPLFENSPDINEIIVYEDKSLPGKLRLSSMLREKKFCSSILFQNAFDAALISFLSGIPERIGYERDWRGLLLSEPIPFDKEDRNMHHIKYYLNLIEKAGIIAGYSTPYIYLSLEERLRARNALKNLKRPVIGVNPGAAYGSAKRWPPERFAEVAERIISELGGSVVIFGSESERKTAEEIVYNSQLLTSNSQLLIMAGKTSLRELSAMISECDILLTNDSGPMHIGYAVGTPLIAVFGSTEPALTGPPDKGNVLIRKDIECSPCFKRKCGRKDMACMNAITSAEVFNAVKQLMPQKRAVFFDRDGTLCRDANYLSRFEDLEIFEEIEDLKLLKEKGFSLIGVSNQSGIARGIVREDFTREVNRIFVERYGFDDFYYCPHHPDERCSCRKPEPGMLYKARNEYRIDLKKSYVVGDKDLDVILARAVGAKEILVLSGQEKGTAGADYTAKDLKDAVKWILNTS